MHQQPVKYAKAAGLTGTWLTVLYGVSSATLGLIAQRRASTNDDL